ncbi:MAG: glycosyl transferase family 2 [Pseudozobellia sp.]|nr:glycosyl transferase family 2 [Pseudozobellia sp.]MBG48457.1 glycosyl transferase family 2 [Pseudozobellia sp.]|tara:strand:- start:14 stop:1021 length:1008 start_codon:yes stop_codon:yes gene_type:complete
MQQPLVSILIPFKNTAPFLNECIESVIQQTYTNWQVLAVNDHSEDRSLQLVSDMAKKDDRILVLENRGKGIISALQTAYQQSSGELITRMDSDDVMVKTKLEFLVTSLLKNGKGHIAVGQVKYFSHRGISNGYERYEQWLNHLTSKGSNYTEIYKECVIPSPCWMTYRDDLNACQAFEPDRYPEDYDLTFRFYQNGLSCIPCDTVLHHWRDYDTRTSRTSEHYAQNYFLNIKLFYFLKIDRKPNRVLTVWGAGKKGKEIARGLKKSGIDFFWLCDNPKKIGKKIYGIKMHHFSLLKELTLPQSIITVANEESQTVIRDYLTRLGYLPMKDFFFFC